MEVNTVVMLRGCFTGLRKDAAAGIDKMTNDIYAENLDANRSDLIERLKRMVYIPQPVRGKYFQGSHKSLWVNITEIVVIEQITIKFLDRYTEAANQESLNYIPNIRGRKDEKTVFLLMLLALAATWGVVPFFRTEPGHNWGRLAVLIYSTKAILKIITIYI